MMKLSVAAAAMGVVAAAPFSRRQGWKELNRAPKDAVMRFHVGMPMNNFEGLDAKLAEISDPYHPTYGQWLSKEQVEVYTTTKAEIAAEVGAWATSTGAKCSRLPNAYRCFGTVSSIEELLEAEVSTYGHRDTGKTIHRISAGGIVPSTLEGKVTVVTGLNAFPVPRLGSHRPIEVVTSLSATDYSVVPSTMTILYNITGWPAGSAASTQAAAEFQDYPAPLVADNALFAQAIGVQPWPLPAANIIGPYAPQDGAVESSLDVQYLAALGYGNTNWYWTEADWQFEFGQDLATQTPLPAVISISYAWSEADQCDISPSVPPCQNQTVPVGSYIFVAAVNQLFAAAVARGTTLLSASGDSGAHGRTDPGCTDPVVRPAFPAASPYITAVGGTELANGVTGGNTEPICKNGTLQCASGGYEIVASNKVLAFYSSGGGFSNVAPQPAWQATVVNKYLTNSSAIPPAGDFNATGRGFPDVAALGHNFFTVIGGAPEPVDGTSAATPSFAGVIALINANRLAAGKKVLGFANPALYAAYAQDPLSFNDVVQGDNSCTEDACPCPANTGFYAAPGWDATTGLGTPNFGRLVEAINAMDAKREAMFGKAKTATA